MGYRLAGTAFAGALVGGGVSGLADDGSIVSVASSRQFGIGDSADPTMFGARSWLDGFGNATRGAMLYVESLETGRTSLDHSAIHVNVSSVINTAAGSAQSVGLRVIQDPTKTGPNALNNIGILVDTNNGDTNQAILCTHGTIRVDDGGVFGPTTIAGLTTSGANVLVGSAGSSLTFTGAGGNINVSGAITAAGDIQSTGGNLRLAGNTLWFTDSGDSNLFIYADSAGTSGNQNIDIMAGGTGVVRVNANTDGIAHCGTGGFEVWAGNGSSTKWLDVGSTGFVTANIAHGFYGAAAVAKQTGVAVTAGGIHAALVNLGLIS